MIWTEQQLTQHQTAAKNINEVIDKSFDLISKTAGISEYEVKIFIKGELADRGMVIDDGEVIVAFGANTRYVHYFPAEDSPQIAADQLIMIDCWARLKEAEAPYADITRMAYYGKNIPVKLAGSFAQIIIAQDKALEFLLANLAAGILPLGKEVDSAARQYLAGQGLDDLFAHNLGHSLGLTDPHGPVGGFQKVNDCRIINNMGYTIEPGLYFPDFGVRSELDIFITDDLELIISSERVKEIKLLHHSN